MAKLTAEQRQLVAEHKRIVKELKKAHGRDWLDKVPAECGPYLLAMHQMQTIMWMEDNGHDTEPREADQSGYERIVVPAPAPKKPTTVRTAPAVAPAKAPAVPAPAPSAPGAVLGSPEWWAQVKTLKSKK